MTHHHGSHRHLLTEGAGDAAPGRLDAIVVPTVRPAAYLRDAATAAGLLGCPLVTVSSGRWAAAGQTARGLRDLGVDLVAVDLPRRRPLSVPFQSSDLLRGTALDRRADTGPKRNLGTVLARLGGWERIAFLDDDMVVPDPEDLRRMAGLLGTFDRVALANAGFPDNSVVCHAHRDTGGEQDSFAGGGAMSVATGRAPAFFPSIYNEDWFDLLDDAGLRPTAVVGTAVQRPYDPYRSPERARTEEFGDVLAEGLFWLLDEGLPWAAHDLEHWQAVLRRRRRFIDDVLRRARADGRGEMLASLHAAKEQLALISPRLCARYLEEWAADRKAWQAHLDELPTGLPLDAACRTLRALHPELHVVHQRPARPARPPGRVPPAPASTWAVRNPLAGGEFVDIRRLAAGDLPALTQTLGQAPYFARALVRQSAGHGVLLVAWDRATPVGTVYIWLEKAEEKRLRRRLKGTPLLTHLELQAGFRNLGLGTVLVHAAEQFLIGHGYSGVALGVGMDNDSAYELYLRLGYRKWRHSPIPTTFEILHDDGTSERKPDRCRILYKSLSAFPSELR